MMSAALPGDDGVLEEFGVAKRKISDIFNEIDQQMEAVQTFFESVQRQDSDFALEKDPMSDITDMVRKIKGVFEILQRDQMKVVFFGRTSNGKSTCINAMLWDKVLPSGIGHTTSCFLSVEGSPKPTPYIVTEENETLEIEKVQRLANALSQNQTKLTESSLVRVLWPQTRCRLLSAEVQILDSPGVDVTPDLDTWIDKYCLNADVFILVANAESTIMQAEKKFFHEVCRTLSKPNIFVLHNRWDASAQEPETMEEVKKQHEERAIDFLVNELDIYTEEEAADRVFFISAKEMLQLRINRSKGVPEDPNRMMEGYKARQIEFEEFERNFEECISQSAIKTKFDKHISNGEEIVRRLSKLLDGLNRNARAISDGLKQDSGGLKVKHEFNQQQMDQMTETITAKIDEIKKDAELKVSQALENELAKIDNLIADFAPGDGFHPTKTDEYRRQLIKHVETGFKRNLVSYCSESLVSNVCQEKAAMIQQLTNVVDDRVEVSDGFELDYDVDFIALNDFKEDTSFKFWADPRSLVRMIPYSRLMQTYGVFHALESFSRVSAEQIPLAIEDATSGSIQADDIKMVTRLLPQGFAWGLAYKAYQKSGLSEWASKAFITAGIAYGAFYMIERLRWTNAKQEALFRYQFGEHAKTKLEQSVNYASARCSQQVEHELTDTFARLKTAADEVTTEYEDKISDLDSRTQIYECFGEMAKNWKNKFDWLELSLKNYRREFIRK